MKEMTLRDKLIAFLAGKINKKISQSMTEKNNMISSEGLEEILDIPYYNQDGKELKMDIYKPVVEPGTELPVIINVHGGALLLGEKGLSAGMARMLAKQGYIVCALEYRLIPTVNVYEQIGDICAGMDFAAKYLINFDVDYTKIFLMSESAGVYLSTYSAAMHYSKVLQDAVGYKPTRLHFKAMALISGMYYTKRRDITSLLSGVYYGKDERSVKIAPYTNPEHPQVIYNLPPCLLVTSNADFLKKNTYDFERALGENGIDCKLIDMGKDKKLTHAFPVLHPEFPESKYIADEIIKWFETYSCS